MRDPSSRLSEWTLARELGFSKTPVRVALAMLVYEGYVDVEPRQEYRASDITLADVEEIFHLRLRLEPTAASLAAEHAGAEQLQGLRTLADEAADAIASLEV